MRIALPDWEIRDLPHLATHFGEFSQEKIAQEHAIADIVFFHTKEGDPQDYPTKAPKIPLSVWYQSAPFMIWVSDEDWNRFKLSWTVHNLDQDAVEYAVKDYDFDYQKRWDACIARMEEKEEEDKVPHELRISDLAHDGREMQYQLTCNHPTSIVFREWAFQILGYLDQSTDLLPSNAECIANPNLAGLPCEQSATSGARKHLNLKWGGRPEDDESGRQIAREKLGL